MRKLYLLLAWLSLSASALSQNLVAYYPFNGNANDESGNAINPTYTGAGVTLTTDRFGNTNKAYNFDGAANSYIRMPADLLPTTNRTISLWFNVPDVSNRPGLLGYGGNGSYGTTLLMGLNCTGTGQYWVQGHGGLNGIGYTYPAVPVNNWYHWVLTINGSEQKIYVNGELKSTANTFSGSTAVVGKDLALGVITSPSGVAPYTDINVGYLNGKLDDVRIYDAAMSDAQVLNLYNSEVGMAAYYPFNGNANDETGNGNNSTYIGSGVSLTTDRFGNANKAYYFDGAVGSYIRIPADKFPATNRTISFWFNADDPAVYRVPFSYGGNGCDASCFLMILNQSGTGTYTKTGHCNAERLIVPYSTPPVNSWKQWVITINGSVQKIYIDGVLQTPSFDANFLTPTYVAGRYVLLGAMVNTDGNSVYQDGVWNFKGKLDEFRIYNNAMTDAQVAAEYSGMEAYYPFNGNANDESGNNHNGTVTEAVLTTDKNGTANKAYQFDGVNDMITAPAHADWSFGNGDFSITSWVNVSTIGTSRIVSAGYTANDGIWGLGFGNHPVWGAGIRINYFVHSGGDYHDYSSNEITGYSIGQWAFVGITKTGSTLTFYFNGQQAGTATIPYVSNANSFLSIGSRQLTSGTNIEFFNGKIDEVRIYNRTLSPNEIQQLADVPMMPDLVAYLPMNGNANDMSGNGHNGTVSEATLTTDKYNSSNSAYEFPTANSNITLANSTGLNFNTSGFTLSSWIKYSNIDGVIIAKHNCWTPNGYLFSVNNNQLAFWLANGGNWASVTTAESFINDKWYFVTAVYDGVGLAYIYVDGVMKAGNAVVYNNINTAPVIISGASNGCPPPVNYHGSIDEVKIYGTPLDAAQVMTLYKESRGSGKAMKFDGVDDFVSIPNGGALNNLQTGTIDLWVKWNGTNQDPGADGAFGAIVARQSDVLFSNQVIALNGQNPNSAKITWMPYSSTSTVITSTFSPGNRWNHLAIVYSSGNHEMYLNGILVGASGELGTIQNATVPLTFGGWIGDGSCFGNVELDEVRIWNTALSETQIRNWMNRKITPDHPAFSNLVGYYTFDEQNLLQAYDSKGAKTGVLTNGPQYVTSGAPIGDGSSYDFINATKSATLTLPTGENFTSTETSGTPGGISVFVVKDPPENQTGILGIGANDHYFGVHVSGGSSPQYTAVYNYTGNPFVSAATEPTLQLFKRNDNSAANWTNSSATLNTTANTLTITGQNTEYILGSSGFGLPVSLLSFQAQKVNATTAKLNWQTATEINNKGFEIQRSFDGNYFVNVGFVNGAGNSDVLKEYSTTDKPGKTGRVYYRLKQIDLDGNSKLSQIVSIIFDKQGLIKVYPNPAQQQVIIEGVDQYSRVQLLDAAGKLIKEQLNNSQYLLTLNLEGLKSGMYLLRLINGNDNQTIKLMIEN